MVDLHTDLQDGLLLAALVSKLTNQSMVVPHTSHPLTLLEKEENVNTIFLFLEKEGLGVVHEDNGNFSECPKLIVNCCSIIM